MALHDEHRKRMKERFLKEGLDSFAPHNVLELLLFYSIPQKDVNGIAHQLVERFGSVSAVFDASVNELCSVGGIGEHSAVLIKMVPQMARYYFTDKNNDIILDSTAKAISYLLPRYFGVNHEMVYVVCLDSKCRVLGSSMVHEGSINAVEINVRKVVLAALSFNAVGVIIAHNHPGGIAVPSTEDIMSTEKIKLALGVVGIGLLDHVILSENDGVSMVDSGAMHL